MNTSINLLSNIRPSTNHIPSDNTDVEYNRGIFRITVPSLDQNNDESNVGSVVISRQRMRFIMYVSIDASGSMDDVVSKRGQISQTKMDFVHMTMTNMIEYIASQENDNPHAEFYITIISFDSFATCVLPLYRVTMENKDHIIQMVLRIKPKGGTNFQKCFQQVANIISRENEYISNDSIITDIYTNRMHVFLTDGVNNEGETNIKNLASILKPNVIESSNTIKHTNQIMIGYGCDHDSTMLQNLCAEFPKSKQWFIDDVEKTGCIFGEILWSAMNTAYSNVKLVSNIEIFDFNSMNWKNEVNIDDLIYDSSRTLYIRVPWNIENVSCNLSYISIENPSNTCHTNETLIKYAHEQENISNEMITIQNADVEKELWRLDTIQTIDEALKFLQNIKRIPYNTCITEKDRLIQVVTSFQDKFLKYVSEKNLNEDPFMIQLADDIFVCINGLMAASIGERYVAARQVSQIQQRAVTVNDITPLQMNIIRSIPPIIRNTYNNSNNEEENSDNEYMNPPPAPRRTMSGGGCIDYDTQPTTPKTPKEEETISSFIQNSVDALVDKSKEDDKIIATFTPSSRGIGSRLRHLSKDAILGYRRNRGSSSLSSEYYDEDDEYYSYGGGSADDTFSSHASPGCARIGRMLSSQTPNNSVLDRTSTCPY